ncbi:MAG: GTP-binding protein, partial [Alphaproteobacteria bacterium]|nr:GTP-binding protein [Alphaproteobacteria bacterium]
KDLAKFAQKDVLEEGPKNDKLRLTVIGRPNAGKSTFINALIGKEKLLTGEMAGVTRDSIEVPFKYKEKECILIDTAGMRKKAKVTKTSIEGQSVSQAIDAVNQSNVVVMMIDALLGVEAQDLHLASYTFEQGKPLLFAVNKMDAAEDSKITLAEVKKRLGFSFAQIKEPIILPVSALKGKGLHQVMQTAFKLFEKSGTRLSTGKLNTWLDKALTKNPPPLSRLKRPMAIKYITQVDTFPPHFVIFVGGASDLPESYKNYLMNSLKSDFDLTETPVRFSVRTQKNPYQKDGK